MTTLSAEEHWYRTAFGPLTAAFWTNLVPQQRIEQEARFLAEALQTPRNTLLLDVPCGAGRHARALGRLGWRVEGLDISEHMLAASSEAAVDGVILQKGDMAALAATDRYEGGYCWGNSFGYMRDEESRAFLRSIVAALKPGARFVLESGAVAEHLLTSFQTHSEHVASGFRLTAERRYALAESAMHIRYRIERNNEAEEFIARQAVYTAAEILRMAAMAGFEVESLHGGIAGEAAGIGRPLIAVLRRPVVNRVG
jgi:SAM-dependent methyltransferase